jgi:hypothetical protein
METQQLKDPEIYPSAAVLKDTLRNTYSVYQMFIETIESDSYGYDPEWRYYRDGAAWLCKITFKKKTVAWLSVWSGCFKVTLYFTEKTGEGILKLDIQETTKERYRTRESIGKLKPLTFEVNKKNQLAEVFCLLKYKASAK